MEKEMLTDTGSNWAVAIACFFINLFILGSARLSPLLFVECLSRYNPDRSESFFPFMLFYMVSFGSGPIIGYLARKFGLLRMIFMGCLSSAIGIGVCFFAEEIVTVTIFWGICYGFGMGTQYSLLPAILNLNFLNNQSKANGLSLAGACLGCVILPPLVEVLLGVYGLSGTFLILSAIIMNALPACMIIKSRDISKLSANESPKVNRKHSNHESIPVNKDYVEAMGILGSKHTNGQTSVVNLRESYTNSTQSLDKYNIICRDFPVKIITDSSEKEHECDVSADNEMQEAPNTLLIVTNGEHLGVGEETKDVTSDCAENCVTRSIDSSSKHSTKPAAIQTSSFASLRVFTDPVFLVVGTSHSLFLYIMVMVSTILIDLLRDKGMNRSHEIAFFMGYLLADMAGRLILGWVIDKGYMTLMKYIVLCGISIGLVLAASAWITNSAVVICAMYFFSFLIGSTLVVFPGIIHKFIEPDYRTMALASRSLLFLPLNITSTPLIGYFRVRLESYNGILYILSAVSFLCCCLCYVIPLLARRRDDLKNKRTRS